MNDADIARILGQIEGELKGMNREIKDVKDLLKCKEKDCEVCKDEINGRFNLHERRIDGIAEIHVGEAAIRSWIDTTKGKVFFAVTLTSAVLALVFQVRGWFS